MSFLSIQRLSAGYGKAIVLRDVNLEVDEGEAVAIVGKNGAGKSTLLNSFFGGTTIRGGRIELGGVSLLERPAYAAPSGYAGWRLTAGASRRLGDFWLGAFVRADGVGGAVFDASPLVRQRHNLTYGLALSWVFRTSDERVAGRD